jgi:hypothetical protein
MKAKLLLCVITLLIAGCAQVDTNDKDHNWVDRTYRTGSNIPRKSSPEADGVAVMQGKDVQTWRDNALPPGVSCNAFMGCGSSK